MMNEIKEYTEHMFEDIKHIDGFGNEYWRARELMPMLEYVKWKKFTNAIEQAKITCEKSEYKITDHFTQDGKMMTVIEEEKVEMFNINIIKINNNSKTKNILFEVTDKRL